ncbi:hypothetical protein DFR46_1869 [Parasphingopyxis lamellibrachiae]|uniref:Uncharacterized protein n=1 Tax=Parasphingopyxis lamellibrachiae TaxID=680125 RepID=A0A3D9FGY8_9SPHN|nr:hypothetical protein DFR46_1869 [Parasphingopyxis lamellibrachiae]
MLRSSSVATYMAVDSLKVKENSLIANNILKYADLPVQHVSPTASL